MKSLLCSVILLFISLAGFGQSLKKSLTRLINQYEKAGYHGTLLVAKGNEILFAKGYGIANQRTKEPNDVNTIYKTESIGKLFTATLILSEIEKGHLRLDDSLNKFFPEIKYPNGDEITIHHLLNHTSGLTETFPVPGKKYTREEVYALRASTPLAFKTPGERFHYSNLGYSILGDILEKVTGKSFDKLYQENLFDFADMPHTRHLNDTTMSPLHAAQPYHWYSSKRYELVNKYVGRRANGSGGWISTVGDFHNFAVEFMNGGFFNKQTWEIMKTANQKGALKFQSDVYYTYGLITLPVGEQAKNIYGNTGGGGGFGCDLYFEPESQYIVVNFMNMYGNSRDITKNVFKVLFGEQPEEVKKLSDIALGDLLEKKGIEDFSKNTKQYLSQLGYNVNEPREYIRIASEFDEINDQQTRKAILKAAVESYPEHGFSWLHYGRSLLNLKDMSGAKIALEKALKIGEQTKDERLVNLTKNEIKKL